MRWDQVAARDDDIDDEDKALLTEAEFALLRDCAAADCQDLLTVAVGTGLRFGEITALMAKDLALVKTEPATVDFDASISLAWRSLIDG